MNDNPARTLAGEIERLAGNGRYRGDEWLRWLTQDVLAGFGKALDKPWDAYQHERLFKLSGLYAQLVAANPWQDILGPTYMELGSHGQRRWLGQYFTPQPIAECMAAITLGDLDLDQYQGSQLVRIMEPAAGSGVMLLATCHRVAEEHGVDALRRLSFTAIDLDHLCVQMTACQMLANSALHGAMGELLVYRGNALGPPSELEVVVHMAAPPRLDRAEPAPQILPAKAPERIAVIRQVALGRQMSLFDEEALPAIERKRA